MLQKLEPRRWIAATGLFLVCGICFIILYLSPVAPAFSPNGSPPTTLILDAGHGGMDGGAVAADGSTESHINLQITRRLASLLLFLGQESTMTRTDESDLSSPDASSIRDQKVSDLHNRVDMINSADSAVVISIHQNMLPGHPEVQGAQVFYNSVSPSEKLAASMQQTLNRFVNRTDRAYKPIDPSVYLMKEIRHPAILVECGFLSSPSEAVLLGSEHYQKQLAAAIAGGFLQYQTKEGFYEK